MSTTTSGAVRLGTPTTRLWQGAGVTAVSAVLFPRLNAVIHEHVRIWHLDHEAAVLIPVIVTVTLLLFAAVGLPTWHSAGNAPARASAVVGVLAVLGVVAFWISAPIVLGGLAVTLGAEGRARSASRGRRTMATVGLALGALAYLAGAVIWLVGA